MTNEEINPVLLVLRYSSCSMSTAVRVIAELRQTSQQQATQITILETTNQELFKNLERRVAENKKQEKQIKELEKTLEQCMGRLRVCDSDDDYEAYHAAEKVINKRRT